MEDVKKLSGEARIDALVIELRDKHGIHLSPEVAGVEEAEPVVLEGAPHYEVGQKVRFSPSSGNPTDTEHIVSKVEEKNGLYFHSLEDVDGVFVTDSLEPVE